MAKKKNFKLAAISTNRNSFGLNGFVFVARDGEAWEAAKAKEYVSFRTGDVVAVPLIQGVPNFSPLGFEIPRRINNAPRAVIDEVWSQGGSR